VSDFNSDWVFEDQRTRMGALLERRDRFAMAALQGQMAREAGTGNHSGVKSLAEYAVYLADAVIAALDASKP
jgi:hypothetical protein